MVPVGFGFSTALVFKRERKVNMQLKYGTAFKKKEGDYVNAVRHCFHLESLDIYWFVHMCDVCTEGRL